MLPSRVQLADYQTSGSEKSLRNVLFSWPLDEVIRFFETDIMIHFQPVPFLPFKRGEHELVSTDRAPQINRHISQPGGRFFRDQIAYLFVERPV